MEVFGPRGQDKAQKKLEELNTLLKRVSLDLVIAKEEDARRLSQMDEKTRKRMLMTGNQYNRDYERMVQTINERINLKTLPAVLASHDKASAELDQIVSQLDDAIKDMQELERLLYQYVNVHKRAKEELPATLPDPLLLFSSKESPLRVLRGQPRLEYFIGNHIAYIKEPSIAKTAAEKALKFMADSPELTLDFTKYRFKLDFIQLLTDKETHLPLIEALINKGAPAPTGDWKVFLENAKDQKFNKEFIELLEKQVAKQELEQTGPKASGPKA